MRQTIHTKIIKALPLICMMLVHQACREISMDNTVESEILIYLNSTGITSKAIEPQEDIIYNLNLFIYDGNGLLETQLYRDMTSEASQSAEITVKSVIGRRCHIFAIANAGYKMSAMSLTEMEEFKWHIVYPDDYAHGMIMTGQLRDYIIPDNGVVELSLTRLMAKLSLCFDRSRLDKDVELSVRKVGIGNCPNCCHAFRSGGVSERSDIFNLGFIRDGRQARVLNSCNAAGLSGEVSLYLLENVQEAESGSEWASYVEIELDYLSDRYFTDNGNCLIYRFYISYDGLQSVQRNTHYHVTIRPASDGLLCEDSWRVDKSGLSEYTGKAYIKLTPSGTTVDGFFYSNYYIMGLNESMHFHVNRYPPSLKIRLRDDMVEDEQSEGRALYQMDEDNMGFTVTSLGRGCLSMMEIIPGEPLSEDDSETIAIQVE